MRRAITAAVGIAGIVAAVSFAPPWVFPAVVALLAVLGYEEFHRLARASGPGTHRWLGLVATVLCVLTPLVPAGRVGAGIEPVAILLAVTVMLALVASLGRRLPLEGALAAASATVLGVLWLGLLPSYLVRLFALPHGRPLVYLLLVIVWSGDSGAYYAGRALGRHKLAPRVSPGKTVEGLVGGAVVAVLATLLVRAPLGLSALAPLPALALALAVTATGVLGDLAESGLKRGAGVKDSGTLFPGHGGVLDRLDSLLFACPVMYHGLLWAAIAVAP